MDECSRAVLTCATVSQCRPIQERARACSTMPSALLASVPFYRRTLERAPFTLFCAAPEGSGLSWSTCSLAGHLVCFHGILDEAFARRGGRCGIM